MTTDVWRDHRKKQNEGMRIVIVNPRLFFNAAFGLSACRIAII